MHRRPQFSARVVTLTLRWIHATRAHAPRAHAHAPPPPPAHAPAPAPPTAPRAHAHAHAHAHSPPPPQMVRSTSRLRPLQVRRNPPLVLHLCSPLVLRMMTRTPESGSPHAIGSVGVCSRTGLPPRGGFLVLATGIPPTCPSTPTTEGSMAQVADA